MLIKKLLASSAVLCALFLSACDLDSPPPVSAPHKVNLTSLGLEGKIVNELDLVENKLYASTGTGLFVKDLATNANWAALGLAEKNVKTFVQLNPSLLLAATANLAQEEFLLYKSADGGQSWQELSTNWGGTSTESLNDLLWDAENQLLYACGADVVAKSEDGGLNWTPVYGQWDAMASGLAFIAKNPKNGEIWTGGQNAIEGFALHKGNTSGGAWQSWQTLIPSPSVAKSIAFSSSDPQVILVGGEDGIVRTTNNGSSWSTARHDKNARFYFGLEFDHEIKSRVYAGSWVKNFDTAQPLVLHISEDWGQNWIEYVHAPADLFGGVWSMTQKSDGKKTRLYLGLYKGGVYEAVIEEVPSTIE